MPVNSPAYRILRNLPSRGYPKPNACIYAVETEPGIQAVVYRLSDDRLMSRPHGEGKRAVLYVAHNSSDAELRDEPLLQELIQSDPDAVFYTCDVRGIGESKPNTGGYDTFLEPYGNDYFYAIHGIMLDRPYIGQKTYDVLRVLAWLKSIGHSEVHLAGRGWGSLSAAFAAVLSDDVARVTLKNNLTSYADIAESERYSWPLSTLLPDVLTRFDLPECYKQLESKNLRQIDTWGASDPAQP
jgi:hypothetical protein